MPVFPARTFVIICLVSQIFVCATYISVFSVKFWKCTEKMTTKFIHWLILYYVNLLYCASVFCIRFLSLGQFYQSLQNWRGSCTKIINFGQKFAELSRKSIFFAHSHKICLEPIFQSAVPILWHTALGGTLLHLMLNSDGQSWDT